MRTHLIELLIFSSMSSQRARLQKRMRTHFIELLIFSSTATPSLTYQYPLPKERALYIHYYTSVFKIFLWVAPPLWLCQPRGRRQYGSTSGVLVGPRPSGVGRGQSNRYFISLLFEASAKRSISRRVRIHPKDNIYSLHSFFGHFLQAQQLELE
jgi:hypothetical protein